MRAKIHPRWQGDNFRKNIQLVDDIEALAKKKGCTVSQIAINWLLSLSRRPGMPTIVPIPGSTKPGRIRENATIIDLTEEDLSDIDTLLASFTPAGDRYPPRRHFKVGKFLYMHSYNQSWSHGPRMKTVSNKPRIITLCPSDDQIDRHGISVTSLSSPRLFHMETI